ncbi:MAG: hypothetical protein HQK53_18710 [Oligoflexia bacterium]|nr:hypothetical protein [Oligoflexia bacterium]
MEQKSQRQFDRIGEELRRLLADERYSDTAGIVHLQLLSQATQVSIDKSIFLLNTYRKMQDKLVGLLSEQRRPLSKTVLLPVVRSRVRSALKNYWQTVADFKFSEKGKKWDSSISADRGKLQQMALVKSRFFYSNQQNLLQMLQSELGSLVNILQGAVPIFTAMKSCRDRDIALRRRYYVDKGNDAYALASVPSAITSGARAGEESIPMPPESNLFVRVSELSQKYLFHQRNARH